MEIILSMTRSMLILHLCLALILTPSGLTPLNMLLTSKLDQPFLVGALRSNCHTARQCIVTEDCFGFVVVEFEW